MNENSIYDAPGSRLTDAGTIENGEHVLSVAKRQKQLLYGFLVYFLIAVIGSIEAFKPIIQVVAIPLLIAIIVLNIRLCLKLYGMFGKIVMITLGLLPLFNFIIILIANSRANSVLKKAGFKVGLMGANIREIESSVLPSPLVQER